MNVFQRLSIVKKIVLGYVIFSFAIILVSVFAVVSLERLNRITTSIVTSDVPLTEIADDMLNTLLAQEAYGRRYAILRSSDILELFQKREDEFKGYLEQLARLPERIDIPLGKLTKLYAEYDRIFQEWFQSSGSLSQTDMRDYNELIRQRQEELVTVIKEVSSKARLDQNRKHRLTAEIARTTYREIIMICILSILFGAVAAVLVTRSIGSAVRRLKFATGQVAKGNFDHLPPAYGDDELGELSRSFSEMAKRLKQLEAIHLDTSPLTRLPGGVAIENFLKKRLDEGRPFAFCLIDLDNFKAFADKYGYARGSEVIKATARVIEGAVAGRGTGEDFVGHIGGDDFVIVTSPAGYPVICRDIVAEFDRMIPEFYDQEDRERGFILGKTRQGHEMAFPIITVSIGVVSNEERELRDPIQIGEIAAELKEYAKSFHRSICVVEEEGRLCPAELERQ